MIRQQHDSPDVIKPGTARAAINLLAIAIALYYIAFERKLRTAVEKSATVAAG